MKARKVNFTIEIEPQVFYAKDKAIKELRDTYAQALVRQCYKKLGSIGFEDKAKLESYLIKIFEKALELDLTAKKLEKLESMRERFAFLHYEGTKPDELVHKFLCNFVALCNKDKKAVESLVIRWPVLDHNGNTLDLKRGLDWEHSKALREDVAILTKGCIREFLEELRETGRIMTSAELADLHKAEPSTDDSFTSSEHDHEGLTDIPSDSSSGGDRAISQDSNTDVQQRSASLTGLNYDDSNNDNADEEKKNINNPAISDSDNQSKLSVLLLDILSWIYELPEWLQEQILNSAPVRSILEETKKEAAILDSKFIQNQIEKIFTSEATNKSEDITANKQSEKVTFIELPSEDLVDASVILGNPQVTGLILPMVYIGSGNIFGENEFGGLANFNGINGIEIF